MKLDRRRFLGGAGALIALPWLESTARAADEAPQRFLSFYIPNGMYVPHWMPAATGANYELPPALASLAAVRSEVTVISGLANRSAHRDEDGAHVRGTGGYLTAVPILRSEERLGNAVSLDQQLVQALAPPTRFRSLQLGVESGSFTASCDAGFACAYQRTISWAGPATPLPLTTSPRIVFDRMFAGTDAAASAEQRAREKRLRASVLDTVRAEASSLAAKSGSADRRKLDEYFTGLRELEQRLTPAPSASCVAPELDREPLDPAAHTRAMCDLMIAAMMCDHTRFLTFMSAVSGSNRSYEFIGVHADHHDVSHHDDNPDKLEKYGAIAAWQVAQFAYLVGRMAAIEEMGGTLLDHSLLYFSSEISDGNAHDHVNLPVILAGRAGGKYHPGRHVKTRENEPIANLYLHILQSFGVAASSFGIDGTTPLGEL